MVTAVAVPMNGGNPNSQQQQTQDKQSFDDFFSSMNMEQNVYEMDGLANDGNWENDTVERSSDLLTNLDAMISAVQTESSALDSMREKLKELDSMKTQLSTLTKRLLEADKANLTLKGNIVKIQEAYTEARKSKQEAESKMVPVHQELNRLKDLYNRERNARLSAQQETTMLKDQLLRLEKINEDMEREVKYPDSISFGPLSYKCHNNNNNNNNNIYTNIITCFASIQSYFHLPFICSFFPHSEPNLSSFTYR